MNKPGAIAFFNSKKINGEVEFFSEKNGTRVWAKFTKLPKGNHGFHIHRAGDLRGEGCLHACDHYHKGPSKPHGGIPGSGLRHSGDLGNIEIKSYESEANYTYFLDKIYLQDLYGRSVIIHEDEDDLGKGDFEDSHTTGHSGKRIGCAIIGRIECAKDKEKNKTRKRSKL